jgi:hypothetical protein
MYEMAGRVGEIVNVFDDYYNLDIDWGNDAWEDWMFDPDYRPDEPLSPEDAIRAMLDGETLYAKDMRKYWFNGDQFMAEDIDGDERSPSEFDGLRRRPEKRKREMTNGEAMAWAKSEESHGWMVRCGETGAWQFPNTFCYACPPYHYQRARLRPDCSGIDESTIQGFEIAD